LTSISPDAVSADSVAGQAGTERANLIVLVDDHELIRQGVRGIVTRLLGNDSPYEILEAATFAEANRIILARRQDIELLILDLSLPDAKAADMAEHLETDWSDIPTVVVSASEDWALVARFLKLGVLGFVPKSSNVEVMKNALQIVFSGGNYFPMQVSFALAEESLAAARPEADFGAGFEKMPYFSRRVRLSPRQEEILYLMFKGRSNKEIAKYLDITLGTVKNHVAAILHAFNVSSRSKAVLAAIQHGYKEPRTLGVTDTSSDVPPVKQDGCR